MASVVGSAPGERRAGDWTCGHCSYADNASSDTNCLKCGHAKEPTVGTIAAHAIANVADGDVAKRYPPPHSTSHADHP